MTTLRRIRNAAAQKRTYLRAQGVAVPEQKRGRPVTVNVPRCPVCQCEISAQKDCKCP